MNRKKIGASLYWAMFLTIAIWIFVLTASPEDWPWCLVPTAIVVVGAFVTRSQKVSSGDHPNGHSRWLWEGAPYRCIHGVYPSASTTQCAWPLGHDLKKWPNEPTAEERKKKVPLK